MKDKDYARELADKWVELWGNPYAVRRTIEGAIREALAKAAEIADEETEHGYRAAERIRALGAKP